MNSSSLPRTEKKFSVTRFAVTIVLTFVSVLCIGALVLPEKVLYVQLHSPLSAYLYVFFSSQLPNCFTEWAFHRYMLHEPVFNWFYALYYKHHIRHHIALTPIVPRELEQTWRNRYPITEPKQYEASFFPWFTYAGFIIFAAPFAGIAQWLLPELPILITVLFSIAWSLTVYELFHAAEHVPVEAWKKWVFSWLGKTGEKIYSFHQLHHALTSMKLNMGISGFVFGIPIADMVLGTFKLPSELLLEGAPVKPIDTYVPKPVFFVRWLDRIAKRFGDKNKQKAALTRG